MRNDVGCISSILKTAETSGSGVCSVLGILSYKKKNGDEIHSWRKKRLYKILITNGRSVGSFLGLRGSDFSQENRTLDWLQNLFWNPTYTGTSVNFWIWRLQGLWNLLALWEQWRLVKGFLSLYEWYSKETTSLLGLLNKGYIFS